MAATRKGTGKDTARTRLSALRKRVVDAVERLEREGKGLEDLAVEEPKWFYEKILKPMLPKEDDTREEERGRILVIDMTGQAATGQGRETEGKEEGA